MKEIPEFDIIELLESQMKDQGCFGDSLDSIKLMQGHIYEWIKLFGLEEHITLLKENTN